MESKYSIRDNQMIDDGEKILNSLELGCLIMESKYPEHSGGQGVWGYARHSCTQQQDKNPTYKRRIRPPLYKNPTYKTRIPLRDVCPLHTEAWGGGVGGGSCWLVAVGVTWVGGVGGRERGPQINENGPNMTIFRNNVFPKFQGRAFGPKNSPCGSAHTH